MNARTASSVLVFVLAVAIAPGVGAQNVATLVQNTVQTVGPDMTILNANIHGLYQGFRTGSNARDFELTSISLYVGDTHESRFMTVDAGLYRGDRDDLAHARLSRVATLTRSGFDDYAHNSWQAPAHTYLDPNGHYYLVLRCEAGCANDNRVQFGMTRSAGEDPGAESGWTIHDRLGYLRAGRDTWKLDSNEALRMRVNGRRSPARAYEAEIVSTPADGNTYRQGENIDIYLKFTTEVSAVWESVIGIRVGDATDGSNYRAARIVAGSGHRWMLYRYQVRIDDVDATGISVDEGGPDTGLGGPLPTVVSSFGTVAVSRHYPGLADDPGHRVDGSFQVIDAAITSTPAHADGYRFGDEIEVTLTFSSEAYASPDGSFIGIRVGDTDDDSSLRRAHYAAGSGSRQLVYRYSVRISDFDTTGIGVADGGPESGFGGPLPTTSAALGSRPVSRHFSGLQDQSSHRVARSVTASFAAAAFTVSEAGTAAAVAVQLSADPDRAVVIPLAITPANGATDADYSVSVTSLTFAPGETEKTFTVTATDDRDDDDEESVYLLFGELPAGVTTGRQATATVTIADDDGEPVGQTVTVVAGRETYTSAMDDVVFNLALAEAAPGPVTVAVRLTQDRDFLNRSDLERSVTFAANATGATLRIPAERQSRAEAGALTATVIDGSGYRIGTPAAARVRMVADDPALIARLERFEYRFDEGTAEAAAVAVIMETLPGVPPPNRSQRVTVATVGGTAEADQDFSSVTSDLTFTPGEFEAAGGRWVARKSFEVALIDDTEDELEEHFMLTLTGDAVAGGRIRMRNPDRSPCAETCQSRIVIGDDDEVGVWFVDSAGNELNDLRVPVHEGERVTYQLKLDRRPAQWVILVREPGAGDSDLIPVSARSWMYSPDDEVSAPNVHHWQEPFPVTVEAQQDEDDVHGERSFRHYLLSDDQGQTTLPDVVLVEVDDEASEAPAGVTLWTAELAVGHHEGALGYVGDGALVPDRWDEDGTEFVVEQLDYSAERGEVELRISESPPEPAELTLHLGAETFSLAAAGGESAFIWTGRELDWTEGQQVAVQLVRMAPAAEASLAVADAQVQEADGAVLAFVVSLAAAADGAVTVDFATADGTAVAGEDYTAARGTLSFTPGETVRTVTVAVLDDAHDEGEEILTLTLSNAAGAPIVDGEATGTIANADPLPRAWLARFGRVAAGHVLDAVRERLSGAAAVSQATIAGQPLGPPTGAALARERTVSVLDAREPEWRAAGASASAAATAIPIQELLANSSFDSRINGVAGRWTVWGRGAWSRFTAADGALTLDGEVATGTIGVDHERGALLGGLALAFSSGSGTFDHPQPGSGELRSWLLGIHPYVRLALHERVAVWGVLGYGLAGELELAYRDASLKTDIGLQMAAIGLDGTLLPAPRGGGLEVAIKADGLLVRMNSAAVAGLVATDAEVSRWRLLLLASHAGVPFAGGVLKPTVEVGGRYDAGAAEHGAGLLVGGSVIFAQPAWGLTLTADGQGLLAHESGGIAEWGLGASVAFDPGAPGRGLALRVTPSWGESTVAAATAPAAHLDAELSYGLEAGANGVATPYAALSQSARGERTWSLGARYQLQRALSISVEGTRSRHPATAPEHALRLSTELQW